MHGLAIVSVAQMQPDEWRELWEVLQDFIVNAAARDTIAAVFGNPDFTSH
jgi:hypothetical protein